MISKQQQKYIQSLHNKKYRTEYGEFIVEGEKGLSELFASDFEVVELFCTEDFSKKLSAPSPATICTINQIEAVSTYKSNTSGIAIVKQKRNLPPENFEGVTLFLDNVRDPGNLGTIIRLADWYGIRNIICSTETVEFYNPKVISSTMGSFTRTHCYYTSLPDFLKSWKYPVYGADLQGLNVHKHSFEKNMGLTIGSESHGISDAVATKLTNRITIPRVGQAESLNAAMATAIILDNIFREI